MRPYSTAGTAGPAGITARPGRHVGIPPYSIRRGCGPGGYKIRPYGPASGLLVGAACMAARNQVPIPAGVRWFRPAAGFLVTGGGLAPPARSITRPRATQNAQLPDESCAFCTGCGVMGVSDGSRRRSRGCRSRGHGRGRGGHSGCRGHSEAFRPDSRPRPCLPGR